MRWDAQPRNLIVGVVGIEVEMQASSPFVGAFLERQV